MATQIFFLIFSAKLGEMVQFDEHIFQMGWFNRQLDMLGFQILPDTNQKHGLVATEFYQVLMIHKFDMED